MSHSPLNKRFRCHQYITNHTKITTNGQHVVSLCTKSLGIQCGLSFPWAVACVHIFNQCCSRSIPHCLCTAFSRSSITLVILILHLPSSWHVAHWFLLLCANFSGRAWTYTSECYHRLSVRRRHTCQNLCVNRGLSMWLFTDGIIRNLSLMKNHISSHCLSFNRFRLRAKWDTRSADSHTRVTVVHTRDGHSSRYHPLLSVAYHTRSDWQLLQHG